jgi:hypothetical protein
MMDNIRQFLEALDKTGGLLFEEGKEGEKIDGAMKAGIKSAGLSSIWVYQPEGYDLVVMEHDKDGEKKDSWSVASFTEAEQAGKEPEEDIFKEDLNEAEKMKVGMKMIDQVKGTFLDIVQLCIELASNKKYKGGFTAQKLKAAASAAKSGASKAASAPAAKGPAGKAPMGKKPAAPAEDEE